jgi:pimeloyl-ACP methyl ester carboxylesterase
VAIFAVPALVLTLATFVLAMLWRLGLALFRRPAPRYFRHTLAWHAGLLVFHLFVTVPVLLGVLMSRNIGTRPDEREYAGPRLAADGTWLLQTRETLSAEGDGRAEVDAAVAEAAANRAVTLTARDGVSLRAFLVPPRASLDGDDPRFTAVLVHGLFRGALEIETPGSMLRDLGGEVLLLEARNHGGSDHTQATLGPNEALDVLTAVDFLRGRDEAGDRPLVLYGVSLGTVAVGRAAPDTPDLAGLILDAPIDDFGAAARRQLAAVFGRPWASTIPWSVEHLGGIPISSVGLGRALSELPPDVPVLVVGGGRDVPSPPDRVRAVFEALPTLPDRKELWIEPEATHGKVWVAAPEEYRQHLARFLEIALPAPGPLASIEEDPGAPTEGNGPTP